MPARRPKANGGVVRLSEATGSSPRGWEDAVAAAVKSSDVKTPVGVEVSRLEQLVLILVALDHAHADADVGKAAVVFSTNTVEDDRNVATVLHAQGEVDLLDQTLNLEQRKKIGVVEDPAAGRENFLNLVAEKIGSLVAEHVGKRLVDLHELAVVEERDEAAWGDVDQVVHRN